MGKAKVRFRNLTPWLSIILPLDDSGVLCGVLSASDQGRKHAQRVFLHPPEPAGVEQHID